jgi:hypothetical protein
MTDTETRWHITPSTLIQTMRNPEIYELTRGRIVENDNKHARIWGFDECAYYEIADTTIREVDVVVDIETQTHEMTDLSWATPPAEIIEMIWEDETYEGDAFTGDVTLCSDLELLSYTVTIIDPTNVQLTARYAYHTELYFNC